jgi:hypothetical protein
LHFFADMNDRWQVALRAFLGGMAVVAGLATPAAAFPFNSNLTTARESQIREPWRAMSEAEVKQAWILVLNSRLGIAALNQLAIEGFISPNCPKSWYADEKSGGFQSMLRVQCPEPRGASTAVGYRDIRVIFNRFEDNVENFTVERILAE